MKKIFVLICLAIPITGCALTPKLILSLNFKNESDITYIIKKTPQMENCSNPIQYVPNYLWWGTGCIFNFGQRPDQITITYTKWLNQEESFKRFYGHYTFDPTYDNPATGFKYYDLHNNIVDKNEWIKQGLIKEFSAIDKLPPSVWHTYTIDTKAIMKKYQGKLPPGLPNGSILPGLPALFPPAQPSEVVISIYLDPKTGKISTKDTFRWQTPTTTYRN